MSPEKRCVTRLLDDAPVSDDSFRHKEVARAMAEVLGTEEGGRALSLQGPWGSGKSTVIQLLIEELKTSHPNTKVVQFDAWSHQGDPLRRTFIENAVAQLGTWLPDKAKWADEIDILARRRIDTTTTTTPELSIWGIFGAYALLLSPVAYQLFAAFHSSSQIVIPRYLKALLWVGALPLLLALVITVVWLLKLLFGKRVSFPSLIYTSSENRTKTFTSKTPDPTSLEFETTYCKLLGDAFSDEERRIVFIVDNLDRLPKDEARSVWSNIKLFFDPSLHRSKWHTKVWVVIPFDQAAIADIWSDGGEQKSEARDESPLVSTQATHFVEKTFQATFRVPPPILTNWEDYFKVQFLQALPCHGNDANDIFRIYDRLRRPNTESPTPRQIKLFINAVGSLHRQWQHIIPITTQAAFVLALADKGNSFISQLQNANAVEFLLDTVSRRLGLDWKRDFSALFYNVEPDKAFEALLLFPLAKAIGDSQSEGLEKLEGGPGFPEILQQFIESTYASSEAPQDQTSLIRAAINLSKLKNDEPEYRFSRAVVFDRIAATQSWFHWNEDLGWGLLAAARDNPDRDTASLATALVNSVVTNAGQMLPDDRLGFWCQAVKVALPTLSSRQGDEANLIKVPVDPERLLVVLRNLQAHDATETFACFDLESALPDLDGVLMDRLGAGVWDEGLTALVDEVSELLSAWKLYPLMRTATEVIGQRALENPVLTSICLLLKTKTSLTTSGAKTLASNLNTELGLQNLNRLLEAELFEQAGALSALLLAGESDFPITPPTVIPNPNAYYQQQVTYAPLPPVTITANAIRQKLLGLSSGDISNEIGNETVRASIRLIQAKYWREIVTRTGTRGPFVSRVADAAITEQITSFWGLEEPLENIEFWRGLLKEEDIARLFGSLSENAKIENWLLQKNYERVYEGLYAKLIARNPGSPLSAKVAAALRGIESSAWEDDLLQPSSRVDLLKVIPQIGLSIAFGNALYTLADKSINGADITLVEDPEVLLTYLADDARSLFLGRLASTFGSESGTFTDAIAVWGEVLKKALITEGPDKAQSRLTETVKRGDGDELEWLAKLMTEWGTSHSKAPYLRKQLKGATREAIQENPSEMQQRNLTDFARAMGWDPDGLV
jgi:hypothetical protein